MKSWKNIALVFILILSLYSVSAQGLGDANLTVEESLVDFVTNILGFPVTSAADVILYVIGPIIGFYFLIVNFATEGYNDFQKRLERREYYESDEDLPTGMKVFSLITSFITVVTIGRIAPSLILLIGALALLLTILMFLGLLNFGGNDDENGGGNGEEGNNDEGDAGGNGEGGATREDYRNRIGDAANEVTSGAVNHLDQRIESGLEESLRYFQEDMIKEIELTQSRRSDLDTAISQAESELSDHNNFDPSGDPKDYDPRVFQNLFQKTKMIEKLLEGMGSAIRDDFSGGPNPNYTGSELAKFVSGKGGIARKHGRNPMEEIQALNGKLDRVLNSGTASPPDDVFNSILEDLTPLIATGHFISTSPFEMSKIASDKEIAEKVIMKAASMKRIKDVSGRDETSELQTLAGWMDARKDVIRTLIKRSERLCRNEMKFTEREVEVIEEALGEDKRIHQKLKDIKGSLDRYSNIKNLKKDVNEAKNMMNEIDNKLATLESHAKSHGEFESNVYQKLKEVEDKI